MSFDFSPANLDHEFPVRKNLVYFNHAAEAALPRRVVLAMASQIENHRDRGAADWRSWEEAVEVVVAALAEGREELAAESADLLYHLLVLWASAGVTPRDVWTQLAKREGVSGLAEKAARQSGA